MDALSDNRGPSMPHHVSLELEMGRNGMTEQLDTRMVPTSNSIRKITKEDQEIWTDTTLWLPFWIMVNKYSDSKQFRIITKASRKDPITRNSIARILAKGPNEMKDPYEITLGFSHRSGKIEINLHRVMYKQAPGPIDGRHAKWNKP